MVLRCSGSIALGVQESLLHELRELDAYPASDDRRQKHCPLRTE